MSPDFAFSLFMYGLFIVVGFEYRLALPSQFLTAFQFDYIGMTGWIRFFIRLGWPSLGFRVGLSILLS